MQNSIERSTLGIKIIYKIKMKFIRKKSKHNKNLIHTIRKLEWELAGYIARKPHIQWSHRINNWFWQKGDLTKDKEVDGLMRSRRFRAQNVSQGFIGQVVMGEIEEVFAQNTDPVTTCIIIYNSKHIIVYINRLWYKEMKKTINFWQHCLCIWAYQNKFLRYRVRKLFVMLLFSNSGLINQNIYIF